MSEICEASCFLQQVLRSYPCKVEFLWSRSLRSCPILNDRKKDEMQIWLTRLELTLLPLGSFSLVFFLIRFSHSLSVLSFPFPRYFVWKVLSTTDSSYFSKITTFAMAHLTTKKSLICMWNDTLLDLVRHTSHPLDYTGHESPLQAFVLKRQLWHQWPVRGEGQILQPVKKNNSYGATSYEFSTHFSTHFPLHSSRHLQSDLRLKTEPTALHSSTSCSSKEKASLCPKQG